MRPPSKSKPDELYNDCRSKSPFSHLRFGHRRKPGPEPKEDIPAESFTPGPQHSPSSSDDMIRIVPHHIAAKRIGNPPRTASLPAGISRLGAPNTQPRPSAPSASKTPVQTPATKGTGTVKHQRSDIENNSEVRPTSLKLHYIHGLPNSKAYPYVRKHEVKQHIAAMHAGSPSPLIDLARAAHAKTANVDLSRDFSETVFYGRGERVEFTVGRDAGGRVPRPRAHQPGNIDMVELEAGRNVVKRPSREVPGSTGERLGRGEVQHRRSPEQRVQSSRVQRLPSSAADCSRSTNPNGGKLKGGSEEDYIPRLRGGSGGDEQRSCSFLLKQLLLTCHRPNHGTPRSDDDLPPPRTPNPVEVARAIRRASGTARLPRNISRHRPIAVKISPSNGTSRTASFAAAHTKRHSILSHLPHCPWTHRPAASPINIPFPLTSSSKSTTQPQTSKPAHQPQSCTLANLSPKTSFTSPVVSLRGGAGSPSTLRDHERLPAGLFWLAGGTGRPITAASWKAQRGKKRMGRLVGMAVHGLKAGTAYGKEKEGGKQPTTEVTPKKSTAKTASVAGSVKDTEKGGKGLAEDKAESVKSSRTHSSKSSSSSSKSSTKSHGCRSSKSSSSSRKSSKSSADVAKEGQGQRDAALDPVPEEAAAPAEDAAAPALQGGAAAGDLPAEGAAAEDTPRDAPAEAPADVEGAAPAQHAAAGEHGAHNAEGGAKA
jgi:hypothetical protein